MLEIHYVIGGNEVIKTYDSPELFIASQYREVPDLEDYYPIIKATVAGEEVQLTDKTIGGLFNDLNKQINGQTIQHLHPVAQAN